MKSIRYLFCWLLLVVTAAVMGATDATKGHVFDTLKVSVVEAKPWGWVEDGRAKGLLYDLAVDLSQELSLPLETYSGSVKRVIRQVSSGQTDFIYFMQNSDLEKVAYKVAPLGFFELQIWHHSGNLVDLNALPEHLSVSTSVKDALNLPPFENTNITNVHTADLLIPILEAGRSDAVVELGPVLEYGLKLHGSKELTLNKQTILEVPAFLWVSKQSLLSQEDIERVRVAAKEVNRPEDVRRILVNYRNH